MQDDPPRPIRVLSVIPTLQQGGAQRVLSDLSRNLPDWIEHHLLTLTDDAHFFKVEAKTTTSLGLGRGEMNPLKVGAFLSRIDAVKADVIHAWMYHCNLLSAFAVMKRVPSVWAIHNTSLPPNATKRATRLINRGCAHLSRCAPHAIVYCSNSARQFHEQLGYDRSKGTVIPNGIDAEQFTPDGTVRNDVRRGLNLDTEHEAIALVARYDRQKDFHTALAAFSAVARARPNARLLLIGQGNEVSNHELIALCRQHGLFDRVMLLGSVADVPRIMNAIDLVFISSSFGEALPVVLLESAAIGVPIVTTEVGNIPELNLLPEQVVPAGAPERLAAAIITRLAARGDPEEARNLAQIRQTVVASFSARDMARTYAELYRRAAKL